MGFKFESLGEFEKNLGYATAAHIEWIKEKIRGRKSHTTVPLSDESVLVEASAIALTSYASS
jgi:hypothetical protein